MGKRNFIVIVCEGMGSDFAPELATEIEKATGVETKFARLAHVVRGGIPTLRDRVFATKAGEAAVDALFAGKSNLVVCTRNGKIVFTDIQYALTLDNLHKGKIKAEDIQGFSQEDVEEMQRISKMRMDELADLYLTLNRVSL